MTSPHPPGDPGGVAGLNESQLGDLYQYIQGRLPQPAKANVITGTVNADGTIADGTGFSLSTHSTTGQYDITFGTAFGSVANVQVTGVDTTFTSQSWTVSAPDVGGVSVFGQTGGIGPVDHAFSFVAQASV